MKATRSFVVQSAHILIRELIIITDQRGTDGRAALDVVRH